MISAYSKLRRRRQLFVDAYVKCGVGADAYRVLVPESKRPDQQASRLLADPQVRAAIAERTEEAIARAGVRQVRVFEELAAIAFADVAELYDEEGNLLSLKEMPARARAMIQAIDCEELLAGVGESRKPYGIARKVRTHSKVEALKLLGQHLKLWVERHEHAGPNGGPIPVKETSELSELDMARRVAFLLARGLQLQGASAAGDPDSGNPAGSPPAQSNQQEIHP